MSKRVGIMQAIVYWVCRFVAAAILGLASYDKFVSGGRSVFIFEQLEISETRLIIASIEGCAALLLVIGGHAQYGALLGFSVMLGALIAHMSVLGIDVAGDGGLLFSLMWVVIFCTSIAMWIKRDKLPFIGYTIDTK